MPKSIGNSRTDAPSKENLRNSPAGGPRLERGSETLGVPADNRTRVREGPVAPAGRNGPTGPGYAKDRSHLRAGTEQPDPGTRRPFSVVRAGGDRARGPNILIDIYINTL